MKKTFYFSLLVSFILMTAGCAGNGNRSDTASVPEEAKEAQTEGNKLEEAKAEQTQGNKLEEAKAEQPEAVKEQQLKSVKTRTETLKKEYSLDSGEVYLTLNIQYPVLEGEGEPVRRINEDLLAEVNKLVAYNDQQAKDSLPDIQMMISDTKIKESVSFPYTMEVSSETTLNQDGYFCVSLNSYEYRGGAHGSPARSDYVYELSTGRRLGAQDIFSSEEAVRAAVVAAFEQWNQENPDRLYPDQQGMNYIKENAGYQTLFYLAADGVHFYYTPYEVGPYSSGMPEVTVAYRQDLVKLPLK